MHVLVEDLLDFLRLRQLFAGLLGLFLEFLADDVVAELDAFVADEHRRTGDQFADFVLALAAEGTVEELAVVVLGAIVAMYRKPVVRRPKPALMAYTTKAPRSQKCQTLQ